MKIPKKGEALRVYKALLGCIVELEIPEDAERQSGFGKKCRASKAIVRGYYNPFTGKQIETPKADTLDRRSCWDLLFEYPDIGLEVVPDCYDESHEICSNGIHFFMSMREAMDFYSFGVYPRLDNLSPNYAHRLKWKYYGGLVDWGFEQ